MHANKKYQFAVEIGSRAWRHANCRH